MGPLISTTCVCVRHRIMDCWLDCLVSGIIEKTAANSFIMNAKYQVLLTRPQLKVPCLVKLNVACE